jgi:hypothetical protein
MSPRLVDIIAGLEQQLRSIAGLRVFDHVPGTAEYPAAFILPPAIDYRQTMQRGVIRLELEVVILVSSVVDRQAISLFPYIDDDGPQSIVAAVDNDKTLGLANINAVAMDCRQLGFEEVAGYGAYGAAVRFLIHNTA